MQTHSQPYKKTTSCKTRVFDKHQETEDDKTHSKLLFLLIKRGYCVNGGLRYCAGKNPCTRVCESLRMVAAAWMT